MRNLRASRIVLIVLLGFLAAAVSLPAWAGQETDLKQDSGVATAPQAASSEAPSEAPSGPEVCKTCHEDQYNSWASSAHWKTTQDTKGGPAKQACVACHGDASSHLKDPSDTSKLLLFEKASTQEVNTRCLTCHASEPEHRNATNSFHRQNDVSCIACHSPHHAETKQYLLVKQQPELCYSCHLQQKAQFNMPFHHRVNEGLVQCTDCHNPHGTGGEWESTHLVSQVRTSSSGDVVCFKCHKDKQGPYVFEHEPVRTEGCGTCHTPHGSPNPRLLKYSNVNLLCLSCHTASAFSEAPVMSATNGNFQQACTLCHVRIHGGNFSNLFFK
jgi:DmsE family decaheme c-type cytochrome